MEVLQVAPRKFLTRPHPLTDDRLLLSNRRWRAGEVPVTVCIAARAENVIIGTSDRMLTSGDVQFEPSSGTKIVALSNSLFVMTAGDAALQAELVSMVTREISARITRDSTQWWYVRDAADLYVKYFNEVRNKRAESAILSPLHLDGASFIANQRGLSDQLVTDLAKELLNFDMPRVSAIFGGLDPDGAHIYTVEGNEANCLDAVGFAAIGIGGRHAASQFMFARHAWNSPFSDTLLLAYYAKRKAEVAPGVGTGTDMVMVGPNIASLTKIGDHVIKQLDEVYGRIIRSETSAFARGKGAMHNYVEELNRQAAAAAAASSERQEQPKSNGGTPSTD